MIRDLSLHLVTDPVLSGSRGVAETVRAAVSGGVGVVQLRDKGASDAETVDRLVELSGIIDGRARLIVNDRLGAAVSARARGARVDGVHLGQGDASVLRARELLGPDALIGLTANRAEHLDAVRALPAGTVDYLGVGAIRPTSTKPDHPPALGVEGFRAFAEASPLPCVAIGGIVPDDAAVLREAGAAGVAAVAALCTSPDPRSTATEFLRNWRRGATPRVLSIAGSDPSGGAGIQADLKSIAANGGYGMAALAALTAQNTRGVRGVHVPPAEFLRAQLDALSEDIVVDAVKLGMLANAEIIETVIAWIDAVRPSIVVLDPVMVATSGDRLLDAAGEAALRGLVERADLVTPNLAELAVLAGRALGGWSDALVAAEALSAESGAALLVKGGHLPGDTAPDALVDAERGIRREFPGARIATRNTHGTGCSLSSALATRLARGESAEQAVAGSRAWLRESLRAGSGLGVGSGHGPVHHFAGLWERGGLETRPSAEDIREAWWGRISGVRAGIDRLPFITALADGSLPEAPFRFYLAQDARYLREYARVLAEASRLAPDPEEQAFWAESARGSILGEMELHASWLTPERGIVGETSDAEPAPATVAYLDHLRSVAFGGDYPELIAALLPCFWLYTDLGSRLRAGELHPFARDPEHAYGSWLDTYADAGFAAATERAIGIVTRAASRTGSEHRARMLRAFETSSAHERSFFAAPMAEEGAGRA